MRNKLTQRQYENEVSWSTSTWLALQAHSASLGGGAHSFGVGDRDRDAARCGAGGEAPSLSYRSHTKVRTHNRVRVAQPYT